MSSYPPITVWDTPGAPAGVNFHQYPNAPFPTLSQGGMSAQMKEQEKDVERPPPIPQRANSAYSPMGGYSGSMYNNNPYQSYMYGGGNTGGMYGYSNFGSPMLPNNPMVNGIENASQGAFQSAQTFIGAFSSVSMMLESTLFAVQNSVRAVAGVADQFGHLRNHIVSTSASFLRILKYYFRKVLSLFRLQKPQQQEEKFWQDAMSGKSSSKEEGKLYASLLFFTVLIATPWFIWKLLKSMTTEQETENKWSKGSGEHFLAEVKFPFTARSTDELSLSVNTIIRLAPKNRQPNIRGWLLAAEGDNQGLVPANYIKILGKNRKDDTTNSNQTTKESSTSNKNLESIYESEQNVNEEKVEEIRTNDQV